MTTTLQDFTLYAGDAGTLTFTVKDQNGTVVDISTVTDILWTASLIATDAAVLTKKKSLGGISFVTNGTDGQFKVTILKTDLTTLKGYYYHAAQTVDASGNPSTVATGRMQVAPVPAWTYSGDPAVSTKDKVRFLIGDTDESDQLVLDTEVAAAVTARGSSYGAAAHICRALASKFARRVDTSIDGMRLSYAQRVKAFFDMAKDYDRQALWLGGANPIYAGGISLADKQLAEDDPDRVTPAFTIAMEDNLQIGTVGNETTESS